MMRVKMIGVMNVENQSLQGAQLSTDNSIYIPDPQPPSFHADESSAADNLPSETDYMLIICVVDDRCQLTPYANHDNPGLHPFWDDAGQACCDLSPTWIPSPWTCGPRPPSFVSEGCPLAPPSPCWSCVCPCW